VTLAFGCPGRGAADNLAVAARNFPGGRGPDTDQTAPIETKLAIPRGIAPAAPRHAGRATAIPGGWNSVGGERFAFGFF
jgi:hypothetical protein